MSAGQLVAGRCNGTLDRAVVDQAFAVDGDLAAGQIDVDGDDTGNAADLVSHRGGAMCAGHSGDGDGDSAHAASFRERVPNTFIPYPPRVLTGWICRFRHIP